MPRNRPELSREEKSENILGIAEALFLEQGFNGTTMAAIAREAGVASNVVHWYFPTKDELFVAVMEALHVKDLKQAAQELEGAPHGNAREVAAEVLADFVCRRLDRYLLISTLHERSQYSDVVASYHDTVHERYTQSLGVGIERYPMPAAERKLVVDALITAIEGLVMHRASKGEARRMIFFLVERLLPSV